MAAYLRPDRSISVCKQDHYDDIIMSAMASQITSLMVVYSNVFSGADQSKHQSSASLAFVWGIHRGPVNSPHKWPVTRKMFPFDDVIMSCNCFRRELWPHRLYDQHKVKHQVLFSICASDHSRQGKVLTDEKIFKNLHKIFRMVRLRSMWQTAQFWSQAITPKDRIAVLEVSIVTGIFQWKGTFILVKKLDN